MKLRKTTLDTAICSTLLAVLALAPARTQTLYIGTYTGQASTGKAGAGRVSQGIYLAQFRPDTGDLSDPGLAAASADPSFLATDAARPFLYAVNEGSAQVSAFAIAPESGKLTFLNRQATGGGGPCHLAIDATGRMLVVANYGGGSFATFPVAADGRLGPRAGFIAFTGSGTDARRQEAPHAHSATFTADNRFVLINDLGTDRTRVYKVNAAKATVLPGPFEAAADAGAGPRHLAFGPGNRFVYVVNELASTVTRFAWAPAVGALKKIDSVSTLPADYRGPNTAAEIAIGGNGRALYASNRGHDSIAVFQIARTGALRLIQNVPCGGRQPRSFALDPSGRWLLAANQESNNIAIFRVDAESGQIEATPRSIPVPSPVCLLFRSGAPQAPKP